MVHDLVVVGAGVSGLALARTVAPALHGDRVSRPSHVQAHVWHHARVAAGSELAGPPTDRLTKRSRPVRLLTSNPRRIEGGAAR